MNLGLGVAYSLLLNREIFKFVLVLPTASTPTAYEGATRAASSRHWEFCEFPKTKNAGNFPACNYFPNLIFCLLTTEN
jgi:hypothetical protein